MIIFSSMCYFFHIKYPFKTSFKFSLSVNAAPIVEFCQWRICVHHGCSISMTSQQNDGWSCVLPKHVNWSLVKHSFFFYTSWIWIELQNSLLLRMQHVYFRPWIHQPSESFGLTLATETTFNSNFCSKTARYRLFLAVVRCCVTTTLAAETFGLLNVYLNCKFGLGLPSFYSFFSLFKNVTKHQMTPP